jgi:Protein of unknown function (DUF3455)
MTTTWIPPHSRSGAALTAFLVAGCASAPLTIPGVPAELEAPGTMAPVLRWFARGTQNYTCTARPDGTGVEWKLTAPEATLYASSDPGAAEVGTHGAGPSWVASDESRFVGDATRAKKVASPDPGSIPWLLVPKKDGVIAGTLGGVDFVQRLDTVGGQPPSTGCDAATVGAQVKVPYTATYVFYRAR